MNNINVDDPFGSPYWKKIISRETGEIFVQSLVEEIVQKSGQVVYDRYIQRRVVPFAIQQAKKDIPVSVFIAD